MVDIQRFVGNFGLIMGKCSSVWADSRTQAFQSLVARSRNMQTEFFNEALKKFGEWFPGRDMSTIGLFGSIIDLHHILVAILERANAQYGITPQSSDVLTVLSIRSETGCTLKEIGEIMYLSPANVSWLVDGLVRKGLVTRTEHPQDRRKRVVKLTPQGQGFMMDTYLPWGLDFLQKIFSSMDIEERKYFQDSIIRLSLQLFPYWEKRNQAITETENAR